VLGARYFPFERRDRRDDCDNGYLFVTVPNKFAAQASID
jgi:hypothetical protein